MARKPERELLKTDWEVLRSQLHEFNADPKTILFGMADLLNRVQAGYQVEKVTPTGDVVSVTEHYPKLELDILKAQWTILESVEKKAELQALEFTEPQQLTIQLLDFTGDV